MSKSHRIVIIEPSPIIQAGLRSIIEQLPDFALVGSLSDMHRWEERIATMRADVIILNPSLVEFHRRNSIKSGFPGVKLVSLLYSYIDMDVMKQFQGMIDIYDDPIKIAATLQAIVAEGVTEDQFPDGSDLSEREKEILIAVAKGLMNKEIAILHSISIHTVISHRKNISRKTGIKSVSGFVVYALLNNLIDQNELQ